MHAEKRNSASAARADSRHLTASQSVGSAPRLRQWCLSALVGISLLSAATAVVADDRGVYVGAQVFGARHASGDSDVSGGVTLGFGLNAYFGVEASYKKTHLDPVAVLTGGSRGIDGVELALRGSHALNDWLGLTAKAGAYQWRSTDEVANGPERGTDAVVGAGLQFRVSDQVMLSTEYEKILGFDGVGEDDRFSLGVRLDFD